jgi:hypothetical protein
MMKTARPEIPAADAAGLLLLGSLAAGWILFGRAEALDALAVAVVTSLLFWAPLRARDYLRHGRVRRNDLLLLLRLDPSRVLLPPAAARKAAIKS